mmetsp:Transcript_4765/g.8157  ORF Transcript_4765/g.8157 Transcript_4765/m.8157 type:complete len:88 (+) Transcript_4765:219-482(+)|eukprot:CAMPEP_0168627244 /NCGR_PEP_ID=MMETSP0449_2-20121227/11121_1 /TAXON_ID=1082188 /ORGANISM="Strombidium rassoulzadegani, Strain ras09" /LENGTH=87 /DNA_ID=CAMNT_0008669411 /DNA_START=147 /DNA_END=410 /DNA_ORIENTATION=-
MADDIVEYYDQGDEDKMVTFDEIISMEEKQRDGKLPEKEIKDLDVAFRALDKDGSNSVDSKELASYLRKLYGHSSEAQLAQANPFKV